MLKITVPGRIHLSLIDLGATGYRRNGGTGFAISSPAATLEICAAQHIDLTGLGRSCFSPSEIQSLEARLQQVKSEFGLQKGICLLSSSVIDRHIGLGSGTAVSMACAEALFVANGLDVSHAQIIGASGRGGASGIGIHTYFSGGFVFDVGRPFDLNGMESSDTISRPFEPPLLLLKSKMPPWPIGIVRSIQMGSTALDKEQELFRENLPLNAAAVHEIAYHSTFGVAASIASQDFHSFCAAINALQLSTWKRCEIDLHGMALWELRDSLLANGCAAVGMSSIGPSLFFLAENFDEVFSSLENRFADLIFDRCAPMNAGRTLLHA